MFDIALLGVLKKCLHFSALVCQTNNVSAHYWIIILGEIDSQVILKDVSFSTSPVSNLGVSAALFQKKSYKLMKRYPVYFFAFAEPFFISQE